jgi:hypothetical protein
MVYSFGELQITGIAHIGEIIFVRTCEEDTFDMFSPDVDHVGYFKVVIRQFQRDITVVKFRQFIFVNEYARHEGVDIFGAMRSEVYTRLNRQEIPGESTSFAELRGDIVVKRPFQDSRGHFERIQN